MPGLGRSPDLLPPPDSSLPIVIVLAASWGSLIHSQHQAHTRDRKTYATGATKWQNQQLPVCVPPATSTEPRWLQPNSKGLKIMPDLVCGPPHPRKAKSGQRTYLCQINQPNQRVSCLDTICLQLALSSDFRQKTQAGLDALDRASPRSLA